LWLRETPGVGALGVISLFAIVWSTDIAAYTGGRLIGGPRLAPSLSPRKTWAGVGAGALAATVAGTVLAAILHGPWLAWALSGLVIGLAALGGDLFESLCKRRFGVKDASGLIPGHGGVMDRLDGLMVAVPLSAGVVWAAPGFIAMLFGGA
jgi:phosphatidate cytidylyltransferase